MLGRLHRLLTRNAGIKAIALIFAVILWYLASGQEKTEVGIIVPLELVNIPEDVAIEGNSLEFIQVRLRGPKSILQELSPQNIRVNLDLASLKPGDNFVPITDRNVHIPRGVELVSVNPSYLSTRAAAKKLVPVKVRLQGEPAPGYRVVSVAVIPNKIYIIGPPARVSAVREIDTLPVDVRNATGPVYAKAELATPDTRIQLLELKPMEVTVTVEGRTVEKTLRNIPVAAAGGGTASLKPSQVQVTVSGPFNLIQSLRASDIKAELDLSDAPEGISSHKLLVSAPEGINLIEVTPNKIQVTKP